MATVIATYVNACLTQLLYLRKLTFPHFGHQLVAHRLWQSAHTVRHIKRGATGHIDGAFRGDDLIAGDMPDAANICHISCLYIAKILQTSEIAKKKHFSLRFLSNTTYFL